MNTNSLIWGILKPALKIKFEFKELHKVNFIANRLTNELNLTCVGIDKETDKIRVRSCETLPLDENKHYIDMFDAQIKDSIEFKEIHVSILDVNFLEKICKSEIYFISLEGKKEKAIVPLTY